MNNQSLIPEVKIEYFVKTTEGYIFTIPAEEAEKLISVLEEGASGLVGNKGVQEYLLGEGNILFSEESEIKYAVFDQDSKQIVETFDSIEQADIACHDMNKSCFDAGGSSTQYGVDVAD